MLDYKPDTAIKWVQKRRMTVAIAAILVIWYGLQLVVLNIYGHDTATWLFYFEKPPNSISPGMIFYPISHKIGDITHIISNVALLLVVGGLVEPYIRKSDIFIIVIGLGYLGTLLANLTAPIHNMWILAGASGGILALVAYSGLRLKPLITETRTDISIWSATGLQAVLTVTLLIGAPVVLIHQTIWVNPPHSGHIAGILLGYLYFIGTG